MNSRPPYLFFSPKCPYCTQLIQLISKNQQLAKVIEPVNIHLAKHLPPQLEGVPAILFRGQLLTGPDTFKWVQMAMPKDNRPPAQGFAGPGGHPSITPNQQSQQQILENIPEPGTVGKVKSGIEFTALPGKEEASKNVGLTRYSFVNGSIASSGTDGIDYNAAMADTGNAKNDKSDQVAQQLQRLQQMRGNDQDQFSNQQQQQFNYNPGVPQNMPQMPQMPQMQQSGMQQSGMTPAQQGFMQPPQGFNQPYQQPQSQQPFQNQQFQQGYHQYQQAQPQQQQQMQHQQYQPQQQQQMQHQQYQPQQAQHQQQMQYQPYQ